MAAGRQPRERVDSNPCRPNRRDVTDDGQTLGGWARRGFVAGSAPGAVDAAFVLGATLLGRERIVSDLEAELGEVGIPVGVPIEAMYWLTVATGPPVSFAITAGLGALLGIALGRTGLDRWPVVVAASVAVGYASGFTTNVPASRRTIVAVSVVGWLLYPVVFVHYDRVRATVDGVVEPPAEQTTAPVDWRVVAVLTAAGTAGLVAVTPYQVGLTGVAVSPVALAANVLVTALILAVAALVCVTLGPPVGLGAPAVAAALDGERPDLRPLGAAAGLGLATGAAIVALDLVVFQPVVQSAIRDVQGVSDVGPVVGLLASFYGGITEEILLRAGLLTALVWVTWRLGVRADGDPRPWTVWALIVLTALLFGAAHLPATVAVFELTPAVLVRALALNALGGVVFGWLYWRRSLLAAMAAHFCADLVLHVVVPFVA